MRVVTTIQELKTALEALKGKSLGLVPTMGALHAGHLSLVRRARAENGAVAVSIFVNPTQFGPNEDFDSYPRPIDHDRDLCQKEGVDLIFAPSAGEMYPSGYATYVLQERYTESFEGEIRTGHFHGVCTICLKLFNLFRPDVTYFGQKDYQQSVVIRRMLKDLNLDMRVEICPTVREADGLALSSRNLYLSPQEREQATAIYRGLKKAEAMFKSGERSAAPLITAIEQSLGDAPAAHPDYIAVVNPESLREIRRIESEAVILVAVRMGHTRLLDNIRLTAK